MTWELHIDGHQINLNEFEQWSSGDQDAIYRGWTIDLVNLSPGRAYPPFIVEIGNTD